MLAEEYVLIVPFASSDSRYGFKQIIILFVKLPAMGPELSTDMQEFIPDKIQVLHAALHGEPGSWQWPMDIPYPAFHIMAPVGTIKCGGNGIPKYSN